MTGLEIAALVAMIAGAAVQYKAQTDAQERQQAEIRRALDAQEKLQREAEEKALSSASKFAPKDRIAEQAQISEQISTELMAPVSESQAIRSEQQTTQGNVSDDYTTAKATSDLNSIKAAEQLARLLGKTTSANRLRMNEGIRLMDTGQAIDQLNSFSRGQSRADEIAINQAGQINPGQMFVGSVLQSVGGAGLMSGAGKAGTVTAADAAAANATADPIATLNASKGWTGGSNSSWLDAFKKVGAR